MFRLGLILGGRSSCNSILAILAPWYIVTRLGTSVETDAFFASTALPQFIFLIVSAALIHILVPLPATKDKENIFERCEKLISDGHGYLQFDSSRAAHLY